MSSECPQLTDGAIRRILANEKLKDPRLQVIIYKKMGAESAGNCKYRFQMTDGSENCSNFIVVLPELIKSIEQGNFEKYTVVELRSYGINQQPNVDRQIIIINDMAPVRAGSLIGKRLDKSNQTGVLTGANHNSALVNTPNRSNVGSFANNGYNSPMATNRPLSRGNVCPIVAITPYFNAWNIKARVTAKAPKRTWSNAKGEGTVFSFDVMDQSGEIRVNAFNKEVDKFYDMIEPGKVYYISKGSIKTANKRFSNIANDYEITLNSDSIVEECDEAVQEVPKMRFKFVKIRDLASLPEKNIVDVIGIVKSIDEVSTITSKKTNKELKKRDITLVDNSQTEVRLTVWNDMAEQFNCLPESVLAIKNALIGDFNGRNLGTVASTSLHYDPEIPETNYLKDWYLREGYRAPTQSLSKAGGGDSGHKNETVYLCQINEQTVNSEQRSYFNVTGRAVATGRNMLYKACEKGCLKKVQEASNGFFHCDKCQLDSPNFTWRLILSLCVCDCTGDHWITVFQEDAERLLGRTAQDLADLQDNNPHGFNKALAAVEFKEYTFRVGSRIEQYMDDSKVKTVAYRVTPIDPIKRSNELIEKIKKWNI